MSYRIYARTHDRVVAFVGCTKKSEIPADAILLEIVEHYPRLAWVKWSMRFRHGLDDRAALADPHTKYYKNSAPLKRLLDDPDCANLAARQNTSFLKFHNRNPHVVHKLIEMALAKRNEGRNHFSMDHLLSEIRWSKAEIDRGADRPKVNARWSAWYSRAVQMLDSNLLGFFVVRPCFADGLVWTDGQSWKQFALEHEDQIQWDPVDELADEEWEYNA